MSNLYGFYSAEADRKYGHCYYENIHGFPVRITCVSKDKYAESYYWTDKVYVGQVTKCIGQTLPIEKILSKPVGSTNTTLQRTQMDTNTHYYIQQISGDYPGEYVDLCESLTTDIKKAKIYYNYEEATRKCIKWSLTDNCQYRIILVKTENKFGLNPLYWQNSVRELWTTLSGTPEDKIYTIAVWLVDFLKDMEYIDAWDKTTIYGIKDAVKQIAEELNLQ